MVTRALLPVQFFTDERRWGRHPQLHRRCAAVQFPSLQWPLLTARATAVSQPMMVWKADCVILAAILAIFSRQEVHIFGLNEDIDRIWTFIYAKKAANVYLNDMIQTAKAKVLICPGPCGAVPCFEEQLALPGEARDAWDYEYQLYQKVLRFWDQSPQYFPTAAQVSRSHGHFRGGHGFSLESGPSAYVLGGALGGGSETATSEMGLTLENHLRYETFVSCSSQESPAPSQPPGWMGWPLSLLLLSLHVLGSQYSVALLVPFCHCVARQ